MIDIFSLKVEEIVSKIKDAQLTSVEVCQKYIERINKFEKNVKAWVHFDKKLLLEKAEEADQHRRSGKPEAHTWSPCSSKRYYWNSGYAN